MGILALGLAVGVFLFEAHELVNRRKTRRPTLF